jgi:hypothetical protein
MDILPVLEMLSVVVYVAYRLLRDLIDILQGKPEQPGLGLKTVPPCN